MLDYDPLCVGLMKMISFQYWPWPDTLDSIIQSSLNLIYSIYHLIRENQNSFGRRTVAGNFITKENINIKLITNIIWHPPFVLLPKLISWDYWSLISVYMMITCIRSEQDSSTSSLDYSHPTPGENWICIKYSSDESGNLNHNIWKMIEKNIEILHWPGKLSSKLETSASVVLRKIINFAGKTKIW